MTLEEMYESLRDGSRKLAVQNALKKADVTKSSAGVTYTAMV